MKSRIFPSRILPAALAAAALWVWADDSVRVTLTFTDGSTLLQQVESDEQFLFDADHDALSFSSGASYRLSDISAISFAYVEPDVGGDVEPSDDEMVVYVSWDGEASPRVRCSSADVSVSIDGQHVMLTNSNTLGEMTYVLSGESSEGSFTLYADYKSTLRLENLHLASATGAAIDVECGKRIALEIPEGTTSTLEDAAADLGQKAALYCKGHLEVSGAGRLRLTGHAKHALSTKEYLQLKRTAGTVEVLGAVSDGLHAGQYFLMNGGSVSIRDVGGDGIQAEATGDEGDEDDGRLTINGGTLSIHISAQDAAALKSDSLLSINGGTLSILTTGAGSKALKSKTDICLADGTVGITQEGEPLVADGENTYVVGLKAGQVRMAGGTLSVGSSATAGRAISADTDACLEAGTIHISMTGNGGRGVKSDHDIVIGREFDGAGPAISVVTTGGVYTSASAPAMGPGGNGGGTWPGGGRPGEGGSNGSAAKAMKADNAYWQYGGKLYVETQGSGAEGIEAKAATATAMNFCGGELFMKVYDDCINSAGAINFSGANVVCYSTGNDAIDSNYNRSGAVSLTGGTVVAFSSRGGAEMGIDCDNMSNVLLSGGTLVAGGGSQGGSSSSLSGSSILSKCLSSSIAFTEGAYYSLASSSGNVLTWRMPCTVNSSFTIFATDGVAKGTSCTLYQHASAPVAEGILFPFPEESVAMLWKGNGETSGTTKATVAF